MPASVLAHRSRNASLLLAEGAPITYVSDQIGRRDGMGNYMKADRRRWVDVVDRRATAAGRSATSASP